jgi:hypothetical protein
MQNFRASVQYNDLKGSVAADNADMNYARKWLLERGHIQQSECLIGISMSIGENHGVHTDPVYVTFLISELKGYQNIPEMIQDSNEPLQVKKISIDMNVTEFFALFKRFEVTLSSNGLLEGRAITTDD